MARRDATRKRRTFGRTWWGEAWITALEQRARLDPNRLPRGRTYARHSRVGGLTIEEGEVRAPVYGSQASAYRVRVRVRPFSATEWEAALDAIAGRAGHAAALLDGELPPEVVGDLAGAGIELLPIAGEVGTACSCPDWANPCKHAAAVCYLVADLLDEDPFVVLLLRGRGRDDVLAGLRARRASAAAGAAGAKAGGPGRVTDEIDPGVPARDVWRLDPAVRPALPAAPLAPPRPGRPAPLPVDPPPGASFTLEELDDLAVDAARRAWELAVGDGDGGLSLAADADLARRAAAALGSPRFAPLVARTGRRGRDVTRLATAWRDAGEGGLAVLSARWNPPADAVAEAREAITDAGRRARVDANRVTVVGQPVQLRFGEDGLWYRLERRGGVWEITGPPAADPTAVLTVRLPRGPL